MLLCWIQLGTLEICNMHELGLTLFSKKPRMHELIALVQKISCFTCYGNKYVRDIVHVSERAY